MKLKGHLLTVWQSVRFGGSGTSAFPVACALLCGGRGVSADGVSFDDRDSGTLARSLGKESMAVFLVTSFFQC